MQRLAKFGLLSLELRRLHLDLIYCYKIVLGLAKLDFCDFFEFSVSSARGHAYKLYKQRCDSVRTYFLPAKWLMFGTVSLILFVLLFCLYFQKVYSNG